MASASSTHDPVQLYAAAQERMASALALAAGPDFALAAYTAGLAVETVLQALAHLDGQSHDARHRLDIWLAKCSAVLQDTVKRDLGVEWSWLDASWHNELRYRSHDQWLGAARKHARWRKLGGSDHARIRQYTGQFVMAAQSIFGKALAEWQRRTM